MKTAVFIDGANFYATVKQLGFDVDYRKLLQYLKEVSDGTLLRVNYYTAVSDLEDNPVVPLIDWLDYNGYSVITKDTKEFVDPETGRRKVKGNMDIDLAVDAMEIASRVDRIILFTGDGDFAKLVESLKRQGVHVTVMSTLQPNMIADELRRAADEFIDISTLRSKIERPVGERRMRERLPEFVR